MEICRQCGASYQAGDQFCDTCGAPARRLVPKDPMVGRVLLNQYVIRDKLGEGGFGAVYLAEQPSMQRKVAIKTLHAHLAQRGEVVRRFQREGAAASRVEHPAAVKMFNLGSTDDNILWLAMEFIEGEPLSARLKRGPLSPAELVTLLAPLCEVLDEAHDKGIIHRDLKPENIMLSPRANGTTVPRLLDFGLVALLQDEGPRTKTGVISGTPAYMAPEQWEGLKNADARTDIYALGVIAYRCLSGRFPFQADTAPAWMHQHCFEPPLALAQLVRPGEVSAAMCAVIMSALEKAPERRPQRASAFWQALQRALPHAAETVPESRDLAPRRAPAPLPPQTPSVVVEYGALLAAREVPETQEVPPPSLTPRVFLEAPPAAPTPRPSASLVRKNVEEVIPHQPPKPTRWWLWLVAAGVLFFAYELTRSLVAYSAYMSKTKAETALIEQQLANLRDEEPASPPRQELPAPTPSTPTRAAQGELWFSAVGEGGGVRAVLPPEAIDSLFGGLRGEMTACYERALSSTPGLVGEMVYQLSFGPQGGAPRVVHLVRSSLDASVIDCVSGALLRVPGEAAGVELRVEVRLSFNPA